MKKRLFSLLLVFLMLISLLPTAAFAAVGGEVVLADDVAIEDELPATPAEDTQDAPAPADAPAAPDVPQQATLTADEPVNFCRPTDGATVTVDVTNEQTSDGNLGTNAIDGNTGTKWTSNGARFDAETAPTKAHLIVHLGQARDINKVRLYLEASSQKGHTNQAMVKSFNIQVSTADTAGQDSTSWKTVASVTEAANAYGSGGTPVYNDYTFATQTGVKHIRVETVEYSNFDGAWVGASIFEIEAYNDPATPDPDPSNMDFVHPTDGSATVSATADTSQSGWGPTNILTANGGKGNRGLEAGGTRGTADRWLSNDSPREHWLQIDLGVQRQVSTVCIYWVNNNFTGFTLKVSPSASGDTDWEAVYPRSERVRSAVQQITFAEKTVRRIKIEITGCDDQGFATDSDGWYDAGIYTVEAYKTAPPIDSSESGATPSGNLAQIGSWREGKKHSVGPSALPGQSNVMIRASASGWLITRNAGEHGENTNRVGLAFDGKNDTAWTAPNNATEPWLVVNLGANRTVQGFTLNFGSANIKNFEIDGTTDPQGEWEMLYQKDDNTLIESPNIAANLSSSKPVRYIRLTIKSYEGTNVVLKEMGVYNEPKAPEEVVTSAREVLSGLTLNSYKAGDKTITYTGNVPEGYTVTVAANLEQVVGPDGTIHTPLVTVPVEVALTVTNADGTDWATTPNASVQTFQIQGQHASSDGTNPKPAVIPELMEWYSPASVNGQKYTLTSSSKIVAPASLNAVATELKADIKDLFDLDLQIAATGAAAGDIELVMGSGDAVAGFDNETYLMDIADKVTITATHTTGAYWGTRSVLQALKLSQADGQGLTILKGTARDYPEFKLRGFMLDVGRKPCSMDMLYEIARNMAWYKLNDFHIHLNDNLIWMEDYGYENNNCTQEQYDAGNDAYSAFRLESSLKEEPGAKPLAARDYHYTKAEFKQFIEDNAALGITVVPEIDVPAHAKAITDAFPSLRQPAGFDHHALNDHFNLSGKLNESVAKAQEIFDDYIDDGTFASGIVHFGADEYYPSGHNYRLFHKAMLAYLREKNVTIRTWGSLSTMSSNAPEAQYTKAEAKGVQMDIWETGWANPQTMYDMGFDLINIVYSPFYIVPSGDDDRGLYGDRLNLTNVYNQAPNNIGGTTIPAGSSQMLGSAYAIWQDNIDTHAAGIDEVDTFDRFFEVLPITAVRQWGEGAALDRTLAEVQEDAAVTGLAPQSNPYFKVKKADGASQYFRYTFSDATDKSGNGHDLTLGGSATIQSGALVLTGGQDNAAIGLDRLGWGNKLSFKAMKTAAVTGEEVIFEIDPAYGDYAIKALPGSDADHWKLGFSRELYDYEFDADLPLNEWVQLTLTNQQQSTTLSVDGGNPVAAVGKFVSDENSNTQFRGKTGVSHSSFEFPIARIGTADTKATSFVGLLDDVYASPATAGTPVDDGAYDVPTSQYTVSAGSQESSKAQSQADKAIDADPDTVWHTQWSVDSITPGKAWFQIDLPQKEKVSSIRYLRGSGNNGVIENYDILVSEDGNEWTKVQSGTFTASTNWQTATFPVQNTKYIRLKATSSRGDQANYFACAAEIRVCYAPDLSTEGKTVVTFPDAGYPLVDGQATALPIVTFDGVELVKDRDYTITYTNNTSVGTATATITGAGAYTGSVTANFTVTAAEPEPEKTDLSSATVTLAQQEYDLAGGVPEPAPTVTLGGVTLIRGLHYTVTYANNDREGQATLTVTGIGDYKGTATAHFTVVFQKDLTDSTKTTVTLPNTSYIVTGKAITPDPTVTYDGVALQKDVDYTVSYSNNVAVGTATVTVTGKEGTTTSGSVSVTFEIIPESEAKNLSDAVKTTVKFTKDLYELVNGKAEPEPEVRYDTVLLVKDQDYTVTYRNNTAAGTGVVIITGKGDYLGVASATFNIKKPDPTPVDPTPGPSGGSGGTSSSPATATTTKQDDGALVTTKTHPDGTVTTQTTYPDGTQVSGSIAVNGLVTAVVTVPKNKDSVTVTIPTKEAPTVGQVAVILHPDGTEEIIKTSTATENGVELTLDASATVQIVDNSKEFKDVSADHWANEAITFVTSREIFNGTGSGNFSPNDKMSRAMVCTVLANLEGVSTVGGSSWYEKAVNWAKASGVSDGTNPGAIITREQLAAMLYRYAGCPTVFNDVPYRFRDRDKVSDWAELAITWCVENDLLRGRSSVDGLDLAPQDTASRAEVAIVFQRYVSLLK